MKFVVLILSSRKPCLEMCFFAKIELSIFSGWTCGAWRLHLDSPNDFSHSVTVDTSSSYVSLIFVPFKQDVRKFRSNWTVTSSVANVSLKWPTFEITIRKPWQGDRNVYLKLILTTYFTLFITSNQDWFVALSLFKHLHYNFNHYKSCVLMIEAVSGQIFRVTRFLQAFIVCLKTAERALSSSDFTKLDNVYFSSPSRDFRLIYIVVERNHGGDPVMAQLYISVK